MKIANILITDKIKLNSKFNLIDKYEDRILDIPTLIVGVDNVKKLDYHLNYVERKLDDNLFWTFKKDVKRVFFEEDLYYFTEFVYKKLIKDVDYIFIDLILFDSEYIKNLFNLLHKSKCITIKYESMLYIYNNENIYSIDLKQVKFCNYDVNNMINKIKSISKVFLDYGEIFIKYNNEMEMFNYEIKYFPILYLINNE